MTYQVTRDFIGYGANPPDPQWPGGAKIAVNFVINYEEGSEPSFELGDGVTENGLTEAHGLNQVKSGRDLAAEGMFEYGSRVGFWRLHRLFQERNLPVTIFGCALALERNPEAAAAIKAAGYDVCSHGWRWVKHFELSEEEERDHIRKAIESQQKTVGHRPDGWYCRYGPGLHMRLIGHPARAVALQKLLDYMAQKRDVWITRRVDIARHWMAVHPAK
ncbi:MAG: hypothetical protein EBT34_03385 [Acetobacteraceae bacterium]|nr:hypothetical protein [Acetobacteraceae bacterium]